MGRLSSLFVLMQILIVQIFYHEVAQVLYHINHDILCQYFVVFLESL